MQRGVVTGGSSRLERNLSAIDMTFSEIAYSFERDRIGISARTRISLYRVTPHVLRHRFASIANDLGFTEVTIAALVGHAKGSVTSKYVHTLDTALIMAADTISGYIQGLLDGIEFKQTAYWIAIRARSLWSAS